MKFLRLLVLLFTLATIKSYAQLPYPSVAPDFTLTDINGISHNLHSYLDQGYQVILHIDAAWNQVGWSYVNTGWLQNIHNNYGVQNGGNVIVLFAETDPNTNINALYGNGGGSMGNWVANTPYPVIHDVSGSLNNLFNIGYYPTIYSICPNRIVREIGQPNLEALTQIVQSECAAIPQNDPMLLQYTGPNIACESLLLSVELYNAGLNTLENGTFLISGGVNAEIPWTGNIPSLTLEEVLIGEFQPTTEPIIIEFVNASDENNDFNTLIPEVVVATPSSNHIQLDINLAGYATYFGFELANQIDNSILYDYPQGSSVSQNLNNSFPLEIFEPGCYRLQLQNAYSQGFSTINLIALDCAQNSNTLLSLNGDFWLQTIDIPIYIPELLNLDDPNLVVGCTNEAACNYNSFANCDDGSCLYIGSACFDGDYTTVGDTMDENCNCIGTPGFNSCSDNFGSFQIGPITTLPVPIMVQENTTIPNIPDAAFDQPYSPILSLHIAPDNSYNGEFGENNCCTYIYLESITYLQNEVEYDLSTLGISWECANNNCSIDQDNSLCILFNGIPNELGSFPLRFNFVNTNSFFYPALILEHYTLNVIDPCAGEHPICLVTVDPTTGNNIVVWEPQQVDYITDYIIYKESNVANQFEQIGTVPYGSDGLFIDNNSNSSVQASLYKIGALNTCSTEPVVSLHHKTVHLTSNLGINNEVNLIWSAYEGENVDSYLIYRGTSANDLALLTTVSGSINSYTDLSPINGGYYMIEVEGISCDPNREVLTSTSNIITIAEVGINERVTASIRAYPNPASTFITLEIPQELVGETMMIYDVTGREIYRGKTSNTTNNINVVTFSSGSYVLRVGNQNVRFER